MVVTTAARETTVLPSAPRRAARVMSVPPVGCRPQTDDLRRNGVSHRGRATTGPVLSQLTIYCDQMAPGGNQPGRLLLTPVPPPHHFTAIYPIWRHIVRGTMTNVADQCIGAEGSFECSLRGSHGTSIAQPAALKTGRLGCPGRTTDRAQSSHVN